MRIGVMGAGNSGSAFANRLAAPALRPSGFLLPDEERRMMHDGAHAIVDGSAT